MYTRANPLAVPDRCEVIEVWVADSTQWQNQLLVQGLGKYPLFAAYEADFDLDALLAAVTNKKPNVLLLSEDIDGKKGEGFKMARIIRYRVPGVRVAMLLDSSHPNAVLQAFRCGASGLVRRSGSLKQLAKCLECVHLGQIWASSAELQLVLEEFRDTSSSRRADIPPGIGLSKREREVVEHVSKGLSNRDIAMHLKLTEHTVKNYLSRVFEKLGVSSRLELLLYTFSSEKVLTSASAQIAPETKGQPDNSWRSNQTSRRDRKPNLSVSSSSFPLEFFVPEK